MRTVIVFAGTTEGRRLSEYLASQKISVTACVATEYGGTLLKAGEYLKVHEGRMDQAAMQEFLKAQNPLMVIDATHPYAAAVSENLFRACRQSELEYLRLIREQGSFDPEQVIEAASVDAAVELLKDTTGNILATTGSKELYKYTAIPDYEKRVFARVLSTGEVAQACEKLGFQGRNLICMQGPFSEELNTALLRQFDCRYLVTKETGKAGGFAEKLRAAEKAGAKVVLIGRPAEQPGYSYDGLLKLLEDRLKLAAPEPALEKRTVSLIGIGMGPLEGMTVEAGEALAKADLLIGAGRMLEEAKKAYPQKHTFMEYDPERIASYVEAHPEYRTPCVLLSGDIGFYSGARKLYDVLEKRGFQVRGYCGISSAVYFCGRLRMPWEDVYLMSIHGRKANLVNAVKTHEKTFTLLGAGDSVKEMCRLLIDYGLSRVKIFLGERLGYPEEKITEGLPMELSEGSYDGLCVALIQNPEAFHGSLSFISDEEFERGKAPMTKSEVRSLSVGKLRLSRDSVVYDVGAGTGSVSVELALQVPDGMVYAIERNPEACELMARNRKKFGVPNMEIVEGLAPEAMEALPVPTHAFIGGSAGNLKEILESLLKKNPLIRIVINTVTLETISEVMDCLSGLPLIEEEIALISVAKAKGLGNYHLMMGQNPIYIITCRGGASE